MGTLSGNYYGGIVKNGLVLMLDAAKKDSYDRLGTTWRDISWNGNNGVLTNFSSPSSQTIWNSNGGGSIIFDGTDDYVTLGNVSSLGFTNGIFTIEAWIYVPSTWTAGSQFPNIISKGATAGWDTDGWSLFCFRDYPSSGQFTWGFGMRNTGVVNSRFRYNMPTNQYIHIVAVINGTVDTTLYENGVFNKTGVNSLTPASNSTPVLVGADAGVPQQCFPGRISLIRLYNRVLSSSEVLQNFNATKDRYLTTVPFEYFVLAGGGSAGGNGGGGGGAGGLLVGSNYVIENTTLTVTVGSGGVAPSVGSNSSLIGGLVSLTATGGGRGTSRDGNYGTTGGSGGGGAGWTQSNSAESGFAGISGQGKSGGNGTNYSFGGSSAGGGGGGYGSSGTNGSTQQGGNGGDGYLLSWNNTGYAGGGAGSGLDYGNFFGRAGTVQAGYGGGGPQNSSGNGRVNSGGGGGSLANATNSGWAGGGAGGSGTVILKIGGNLRATTGNPSIINNGSDYLYVFSGSGTITI